MQINGQGNNRSNSLFAFLMSLVRKCCTAVNTWKTDKGFFVGDVFFLNFTYIKSFFFFFFLASARGKIDTSFQLPKLL